MKERHKSGKNGEPRYAPGLEADAVKEDATEEEKEKGEFTRVTKLVLDRTPDD